MRLIELSPSAVRQEPSAGHGPNPQRPAKRLRLEEELAQRELALFGYDHGIPEEISPSASGQEQSAEQELERYVSMSNNGSTAKLQMNDFSILKTRIVM